MEREWALFVLWCFPAIHVSLVDLDPCSYNVVMASLSFILKVSWLKQHSALTSRVRAGETHSFPESKMWKFLSYNVWFREDLEMHNMMLALGNLIRMHSLDVICLQVLHFVFLQFISQVLSHFLKVMTVIIHEVTPTSYEIFQQSGWWKGYRCSIANRGDFTAGYFCIQLSKLPVKSFSSRPFHNSIMGRELCVAEVEIQPDTTIVIATSHLESPYPGPPTWDQMFSKEHVVQANEVVKFLEKN
ncbi:hypothetical protein ACS0TY_002179 [Phlomoides rotata]